MVCLTRELLSLILPVLLASTAIAQTLGGALLLKNDRLLVGSVEQRGNLYLVSIAEQSRVSIPVEQALYVGRDLEDLYQYKVTAIKRWNVGDHFQMTRWCLLNGLLDQAAYHYQEVDKQASGHPRVEQLALELQKKLLEQPEFRDFLGLASISSPPAVGSYAEGTDTKETDNAAVMTASSTLARSAMHPQIAAQYSQRIQPILLNRCSQTACHGVKGENSLRIVEPYARAFARISTENLGSVLQQVASDRNELSPLLRYATTAHGIQKQPAISITETHLLSELGNWIQFVQNPVVSAVAANSVGQQQVSQTLNQAGQFVPFSPAVKLMPVEPGGSGLRQVPRSDSTTNGPAAGAALEFPGGGQPSLSEIDALDRELQQILGETPTQAGGTSQSADAFDPNEFNRQSTPPRQ